MDRILTSGLKPKAMDGKELIKDLQNKYGNQIEILAGSGINASNARKMMEDTGIYQYIVRVKIGSMIQQLKRMKFHMPMHLRLMKMIMMLFQKNLLKKL